MRVDDGVPIHYSLAEIQVRGTDRLHRTNEHENVDTDRRRHNEEVNRWNNILRNLASRNARRMILMDIEYELRAKDQARLTTDGIHFDSIEGQAWMNRVFKERLVEMEVELFDTGVLNKKETTNEPAISTFVPPNLETRLGTVPAVTYRRKALASHGKRQMYRIDWKKRQ